MCVRKNIVIKRPMFGLIFGEYKIGHCWKTIFISVKFGNGINNHLNFFQPFLPRYLSYFSNVFHFFNYLIMYNIVYTQFMFIQ